MITEKADKRVCKIQKTINAGTVSKHQRKAAGKRGGLIFKTCKK
ncbi:hypothetical protein BCO26_0413 [Heyndrickxia coagulans 2-6]|nr:hypothetical protein BCO26_0413 [Heyndrickxia coagulans 2-6]